MATGLGGWFRELLKDIASVSGLPVVLIAIVFVIAWRFVDPAPPSRLVISTGAEGGAYHEFAAAYRKILARDRIELVIRPSDGAVENLTRLKDSASDVDLAFVQDGLAGAEEHSNLVSLGSFYYEPLWIFYRPAGGRELARLSELKGLRVAPGGEGSGTRSLSLRLLAASGISQKNARLLSLGGAAAAEALLAGQVDVAFFVSAVEPPLIQKLLRDGRVRAMSLAQAEAYSRQFPYLQRLMLPHGAIDLEKGIPSRDLELIAPTATLVARDSLHPALVYLLLKAATEVHGGARLLQKDREFPNRRAVDFPLSEEAERYYRSGSVPWLQRVLPFWVATFVDRMLVLLIPLIALLLPLSRMVPALYSWRVRSKVYRWYGELALLEAQLRQDGSPEARQRYLQRLDWIEESVNDIRLPLAFTEHRYFLREHIELVRRRLAHGPEEGTPAGDPAGAAGSAARDPVLLPGAGAP
jgi:TRAP transporter TAXI family solute receptor